MDKYGRIERQQKLYQLVEYLDPKTEISIWLSKEENLYKGKVYKLYDWENDTEHKKYYNDYVLEYIRFDFDGISCIIEPGKY